MFGLEETFIITLSNKAFGALLLLLVITLPALTWAILPSRVLKRLGDSCISLWLATAILFGTWFVLRTIWAA